MNPEDRAVFLISSLGLAPHPEGGFFREVFRSRHPVQALDARPARQASTTIYYLLAKGQTSRWHRVASDETWHFYEGAPLQLFTADSDVDALAPHVLGPVGDGMEPVHVVPANFWQAARSMGAYSLVGCTVAPGFEFEDFLMLRDDPARTAALRERHPRMAEFI